MRPLPRRVFAAPCLLVVIACGGGGGGGGSDNTSAPPPVISTQPQNKTVNCGNSATFSVTASGKGTLQYQWSKNGAQIQGATQSLFVTPTTHPVDSGSIFKVIVSDSFGGSVTSSNATLFVGVTATGSQLSFDPAGRSYHTATLLPSGKVLIFGGTNETKSISGIVIYDPILRTFTQSAGNYERSGHTSTLLLTGKVLIFGGYGYNSYFGAQIYDYLLNSFTGSGQVVNFRVFHTATRLQNGKVLITGGQSGATVLATSEIYDPATDSFRPSGPMNLARAFHTATLLSSGKVLIAGGNVSQKITELYDPESGKFSIQGELKYPHFFHSADLLPNGKVLIVGSPAAELYDPTIGLSNETYPLPEGFSLFSSSRLSDSRVVIIGGHSTIPTGGYVYSYGISCFDPSTNQQNISASLTKARSGHTSTLLPTGQVLVIGGKDKFGDINTTELFTFCN